MSRSTLKAAASEFVPIGSAVKTNVNNNVNNNGVDVGIDALEDHNSSSGSSTSPTSSTSSLTADAAAFEPPEYVKKAEMFRLAGSTLLMSSKRPSITSSTPFQNLSSTSLTTSATSLASSHVALHAAHAAHTAHVAQVAQIASQVASNSMVGPPMAAGVIPIPSAPIMPSLPTAGTPILLPPVAMPPPPPQIVTPPLPPPRIATPPLPRAVISPPPPPPTLHTTLPHPSLPIGAVQPPRTTANEIVKTELMNRWQSTSDSIQAAFQTFQEENESLKAQLQQQKDVVASQVRVVSKEQSKNSLLTDELSSVKAQKAMYKTMADQLTKDKKDLKTAMADLNAEYQSLKQKYEALKTDKEEVDELVDGLATRFGDFMRIQDHWKKRVALLEDRLFE